MEKTALIKSCQRNDSNAQRAFYDLYKSVLFRICLRYGRDRSEAEDMLQESFITIFKDIAKLKDIRAVEGWIRRVTVNCCLQIIRKRKRHGYTEEISEAYEIEDVRQPDIYSKLGAQALTKMIQTLPDGYRTVFNLYVVEGYSHKEIAELLNIGEGTSKSQLSKAKALLRRQLEKIIL